MSKAPTTLEMDGLYSREDIDNRYRVMSLCSLCNTWNELDTRESKKAPCTSCGAASYDQRTTYSIRTWNRDMGKKKKKPKDDDRNQGNAANAWNNPQFIKSKYKK